MIEKECQCLHDQELGLDYRLLDFLFTNDKFLLRLCEVLQIESWIVECTIFDIQEQIKRRQAAYECRIFVDTGFRRKNEAIFILAFSEVMRNFLVPISVRLLPCMEQIEWVCQYVKNHKLRARGWSSFAKVVVLV